jgi:hypothetical protein
MPCMPNGDDVNAFLKRFFLALSFLSAVGADINIKKETEVYCSGESGPQAILLARQALESVERVAARIHIKSQTSLVDGKLSEHSHTVRSLNVSSSKVNESSTDCLRLFERTHVRRFDHKITRQKIPPANPRI